MPCQRSLFVALLAVLSGAGPAACGGSSSETPPPLEPDPRGFHYAPTQFSASDRDAGDVQGTGDDNDDKARPNAPPTVGEQSPNPR